jgi:hypothetical protein
LFGNASRCFSTGKLIEQSYVIQFRVASVSMQGLKQFREAIAPFLDDWQSIDLRIIARREKDDRWHFDSIRAVLSHNPIDLPLSENLPTSPSLLVIHQRWKASRIDDLLASISTGELSVGKDIVDVKFFDSQSWRPVTAVDYRFWDRGRARSEFGVDFASFVVRVWQSYMIDAERLRSLDHVLRAENYPWDGLGDLREHFLGFSYDKAVRPDATVMEVIAPLGVRLNNDFVLDGDRLSVSADLMPGVAHEAVSLPVIAALSNGSIVRLRGRLEKAGQLGLKMALPGEVTKAKVIAVYRGVDVDRFELVEQANSRLAVLGALGVGSDDLRSRIEDSSGREFERWIAILFQLLGLSPAHYGGTKVEAPDIVAFSESGGWLLVVECTEREPDLGGKLTKLSTRTKVVRQALAGLNVHPVLITAMPRIILNKTDLEKASKERISVLAIEEIRELLEMAKESPQPNKARDYILSKTPYETPSLSLFG